MDCKEEIENIDTEEVQKLLEENNILKENQ